VRLRNLAQLPSSFSWQVEAQGDLASRSGQEEGELSMRVTPSEGVLQPGEWWQIVS